MKRWVVYLALLLSMPTAAWSQQVVRQMPLTLRLDVTAQGAVSAVSIMGPAAPGAPGDDAAAKKQAFPDSLVKAVEQVAGRWRFKAPIRDGHPVSGRTYASTTMKILKLADGSLRLALDYHRNGPWVTFQVAPRYPAKMRQLRHEGAVVVEATVQPDGKLVGAHVVKAFSATPESERVFSRTALLAVSYWKAQPMQVAGQAVATRVRKAFYFELSGMSNPRAEYGKQVDALLSDGSGTEAAATRPAGGQIVAMDSPFVKRPSS